MLFALKCNMCLVTQVMLFYVYILYVFVYSTVCPDQMPGLQPWTPGFSESHRVTIGYGRKLLLTSSATVHSIEILNGGIFPLYCLPSSIIK